MQTSRTNWGAASRRALTSTGQTNSMSATTAALTLAKSWIFLGYRGTLRTIGGGELPGPNTASRTAANASRPGTTKPWQRARSDYDLRVTRAGRLDLLPAAEAMKRSPRSCAGRARFPTSPRIEGSSPSQGPSAPIFTSSAETRRVHSAIATTTARAALANEISQPDPGP